MVRGAWFTEKNCSFAERPLKEIDREEHTEKNVLCRSKKSAPGGATVLWGSIGNEEYEIVGVFSVHVGTTTLVSWCCERDAKARLHATHGGTHSRWFKSRRNIRVAGIVCVALFSSP